MPPPVDLGVTGTLVSLALKAQVPTDLRFPNSSGISVFPSLRLGMWYRPELSKKILGAQVSFFLFSMICYSALRRAGQDSLISSVLLKLVCTRSELSSQSLFKLWNMKKVKILEHQKPFFPQMIVPGNHFETAF